ncbi:MAG TPA: enoyl-CoA hydratase/isomerase family protein [Mesorhizobium sp.]|nr:enoyl-CoA hydratase/isomerase family protein [Mesorhizobium sp.]
MDFGAGDEMRFERIGRAGVVTLTRPNALNAVTHRMLKALGNALSAWEHDSAVALVMIKGEGPAFSAGGDLLDIYEAGRKGTPLVEFFADEYRLNAKIAGYPKPYVALINGIVMGGGVGVSFHGSHRIMTENAQFAMPEVGIGFFPDVGASYLLPRLKRGFGMYLGLTGNRIRYGDALWSGLATHAVDAASLATLIDGLAESGSPDDALDEVVKTPPRETDDATIHEIGNHFMSGTLNDLMTSLTLGAEDEEDFALATLATLRKRSPTSINVAFRQINAGAMLSIEECMRMDFRILNRMLAGHDFYEGIRAALIDKGSAPQWRPATLEEVDPASIESYFAPLKEELVL